MRLRLLIALPTCVLLAGCTILPPIEAAPSSGAGQSAPASPAAEQAAPTGAAPGQPAGAPPAATEPPSTPTDSPTTAATTGQPTPPGTSTPTPGSTLDDAVLTTAGLGPIQLGMTWDELNRAGWLQVSPHCPPALVTSQLLESRGVSLVKGSDERLNAINLTSPHYATRSGARVGMTFGELDRIYGSSLQRETKHGYQPVPTAFVRGGDREVVFAAPSARAITDSTRVEWITARPYSDEYMYDGC